MPELPMLRDPVCPAALKIAGTSRSAQGVVCRLMLRDAESDPGLRMTPRDLQVIREQDAGVYLSLRSDPATVTGFCHGDAVPVVTGDEGQARASYSYCPVWQAARDRALAGDDGLYDEGEPESVSMGVGEDEPPGLVAVAPQGATHEADVPMLQARRDLDELAPPKPGERLAPTVRSGVWG